jgi:hypothetical protein
MKPVTDSADAPATLETRLERLCGLLHELPETGRRSTDHQATRMLLSIDDIVGRVRALAQFIDEGGAPETWDLVDHTSAQMLLRDLAIIARDLRAVAATVSSDLATAETQLRDVSGRLSDLVSQIEWCESNPALPATPDAP